MNSIQPRLSGERSTGAAVLNGSWRKACINSSKSFTRSEQRRRRRHESSQGFSGCDGEGRSCVQADQGLNGTAALADAPDERQEGRTQARPDGHPLLASGGTQGPVAEVQDAKLRGGPQGERRGTHGAGGERTGEG